MNARLDAVNAELIDVRRDIHRHPETSGQEVRTARLVTARLKRLGFDVTTDVGGHGVIAVLRGAMSGPVVAFRADMDAVPSDAPDSVEFRSEIAGVRHICGHDVHTTIGLALAEAFAAVRDQLPGGVMLIFQPAEENGTGAKAMLADGVFDAAKPSAIYAYHTAPMEVGQLVTEPALLMPPRHGVEVRIIGSGDVSAAAAAVTREITAVGTMPLEQSLQPATDPSFIFAQVAPPEVKDGATVVFASITTASDAAESRAKDDLERRLGALEFPGLTVTHRYEHRWIAGVTNTPALVARGTAVAEEILGAGSVQPLPGITPAFSEDFGSFQQLVPGVMFFLGVSNQAKGIVGMPHSPNYVADEAAISLGAKVMAAIMLDRLSQG
jgi:metal-dependent amidase/aminoacylase/carboxypeptidase family protein